MILTIYVLVVIVYKLYGSRKKAHWKKAHRKQAHRKIKRTGKKRTRKKAHVEKSALGKKRRYKIILTDHNY